MSDMNGYEELWLAFWVLLFFTIILVTLTVQIGNSQETDTEKCIEACKTPGYYDDSAQYIACLNVCMQNRTCGGHR